MKKLLFLSSALLMTMAGAHSADLVEGAITGGANTCTVDVLKVYENNATANTIATWSPVTYTCTPGQYLLQTDTNIECTECPVGSYCPGGEFTVETNTSITQCPDTYTSDTGATGENECYIGCELACSTNVECPPHSKNCTHSEFKTTGKQFVDSTCNAYPSVCPIANIQCDTGYSIMTDNVIEVINSLATDSVTDYSFLKSCSLNNEDEMSGDIDNGVNDCDILEPGQALLFDMALFEFSLNQYDANTPGVIRGEESCTDMVGDTCLSTMTPTYLPNANFDKTITGDNLWATIKKIKIPSTDSYLFVAAFQEFSDTGNISDATLNLLAKSLKPQNWANVQELLEKFASNSFASEDELMQEYMTVLLNTFEWLDVNTPWFKPAMMGAVPSQFLGIILTISSPYFELVNQEDFMFSTCFNNTININWNPDNGTPTIENMCYYDGTVVLPDDPVKPGYTFSGWKLVE